MLIASRCVHYFMKISCKIYTVKFWWNIFTFWSIISAKWYSYFALNTNTFVFYFYFKRQICLECHDWKFKLWKRSKITKLIRETKDVTNKKRKLKDTKATWLHRKDHRLENIIYVHASHYSTFKHEYTWSAALSDR